MFEDYISGNAKANNRITLYGDYLSKHSRLVQTADIQLDAELQKEVAFTFRVLPSPLKASETAARFALAAGLQGKYWDVHRLLFDVSPDFSREEQSALAAKANVNVVQLRSDMYSTRITDRLRSHQNAAKQDGVMAIPALFINGRQYEGVWDDLSIMEEIRRPLGVLVSESRDRFFNWAASAGLVLILATLAAIVFVNSGFNETYLNMRDSAFGFTLGDKSFELPLLTWINDGLMAIFFLIVGIEIKREIVFGELSTMNKAALPIVGAIGGMFVPVCIYLSFNLAAEAQIGWGIPMATDIAFTLGLIALLGSSVPVSLKIFVSALAIADDLGAIIVIALFYGHGFHAGSAWMIGFMLAILVVLNKSRVYSHLPYMVVGIALWFFVFESGLHATIAGVLTAALIPSRPPANIRGIAAQTATILDSNQENIVSHNTLIRLQRSVSRLREPSFHLQHRLEGWVNFMILPLFAFFNTGILMLNSTFDLVSSVSLGIILGLVVGKPLGIVTFCWIAIKFQWAQLPDLVSWGQLCGASCLAGVGFTMSIFIATAAFSGELLNSVKLSVLVASVTAALLGIIVLRWSSNRVAA